MARPTKEWIGKRDDSMPPPRVRQRIFDGANGICNWCKMPIKVPVETWQADHVKAIINGGENREANLAPIHGHCHVEKTGTDVAEKKKVAKKRQKHLGITAPKQPIPGRGFPKTDKPEKTSTKLDFTRRRSLYAPVGQLWDQPTMERKDRYGD